MRGSQLDKCEVELGGALAACISRSIGRPTTEGTVFPVPVDQVIWEGQVLCHMPRAGAPHFAAWRCYIKNGSTLNQDGNGARAGSRVSTTEAVSSLNARQRAAHSPPNRTEARWQVPPETVGELNELESPLTKTQRGKIMTVLAPRAVGSGPRSNPSVLQPRKPGRTR